MLPGIARLSGLVVIGAGSLVMAYGQDVPLDFHDQPVASEAPAPKLGTLARLLQPVVPAYPESARMLGQEGWVTMSFVVSPDGEVIDPVVVDSNGIAVFEAAALKAITGFRYSPATWNGVPVEQCASAFRYVFTISQPERGGRPEFLKTYMRISELLDGREYASADARLTEAFADGAWNLYEDAWLRLLSSRLKQAQGDNEGRAEGLRRAIAYDGKYLSPKTYQWALGQLLPLEVSLGRYQSALKTYGQMSPESRQSERARMAIQIAQAAITGTTPLEFKGVIEYRSGCTEGRPNWYHDLVRTAFLFTKASPGDDFELRCDWRRVVADVVIGKLWQVPEEWGSCRLFVFGEVGGLVELTEPAIQNTQHRFNIPPPLVERPSSLLEGVNSGFATGPLPSEN